MLNTLRCAIQGICLTAAPGSERSRNLITLSRWALHQSEFYLNVITAAAKSDSFVRRVSDIRGEFHAGGLGEPYRLNNTSSYLAFFAGIPFPLHMFTRGTASLRSEITVNFSYLDFRIGGMVDKRSSIGAGSFDVRLQYRFGDRPWASAGVPVVPNGYHFKGSLFHITDMLQVKFDLVLTRLDGAVTAPVTLTHNDSSVIDVRFPY